MILVFAVYDLLNKMFTIVDSSDAEHSYQPNLFILYSCERAARRTMLRGLVKDCDRLENCDRERALISRVEVFMWSCWLCETEWNLLILMVPDRILIGAIVGQETEETKTASANKCLYNYTVYRIA